MSIKVFHRYLPIILIIILFGALLSLRLGRDYLEDWDECIYAEYAKEMKKTNHFLTYRWNYIPVYEKPPLLGWLMQIPYLFGINELTSRILSIFFGMSLLFIVYHLSLKYFSRSIAIISSLLLLASKFFIVYIFYVNTDMGFTFFIFVAFYFFLESYFKKKFSFISGVFFGLALLHKGFLVLIFLMPCLFFYLIGKKQKMITSFSKLMVGFFITILPWHIYQLTFHWQEFIKVYFVDNLFIRATNSIFPEKSNFFYFNLLGKDTFPWNISFLACVIIYIIIRIKNKKNIFAIDRKQSNWVAIITLVVALFYLLSLNLVRTKLKIYAIPLYPFIAILMAICIERIFIMLNRRQIEQLLILIIFIQALITVFDKFQILRSERKYSPSDDVFLEIKNRDADYLEYLVDPYLRDVKQKPTEKINIPAQFAYGEKPCVAFYSEKRVNLYYSENEFRNRFNVNKKGLFLINKNDDWVINNLSIKILYKNDGYLLFEN